MDFMRHVRNVFVLTLVYSFVLFLTVFFSSVLFIYLSGTAYISFTHADILLFFAYIKWLFGNYAWVVTTVKAGQTDQLIQLNNYLIPKIIGCAIGPITIVAIIIFIFRDPLLTWRPFKKREALHGDAKWAGEEEVKRAGLRSKDGLLIGKDSGGYYVAPGYQHALLFAPTGSGKGVGFVIPNLLFWDESVLVHDIKLENHEITSGWRAKRGQKVFVWSPAEPDGITHCYNPIDWVSTKPGQMVDDVQKIANLILPEKEFWNNEARTLFVGVVLYLLAVPDKIKSFGQVVRELRSDDVIYNFAVVLDTIGKYIHPVGYMNLAAFLQKADKERSGVISTLNSGLELWANPLIDAATAKSDFNIQMFKKEKTTVYVGLTPDNIKRLEPLMKVFYQQATEFLSRKIPKKEEEPYGVLFLMDEFPTLGKMEQFLNGIAYFRGYHVRLFLIIQDTQQLKGIYEEAGMNSFLSNSTYRVTFSANNVETAKLISELCGNKTVEQASQNKPKFFDFNPSARTVNVSETQRALLLPQEVINLPRDDQIVLIESFPPIRSKKIKYFEDKFFTKRLLPPTPIPQQEPFDASKFMVGKRAAASDDEPDTNLLEDVEDENLSFNESTDNSSSSSSDNNDFDLNFDEEENKDKNK
ncbi:MAG: type IV secretory system conjugative DNA transfer family protein [Sphingobacteriia bacterium]|nr:type IV secretory system conjugative DNA transfer family protein [Sphingobacteriia bacterium]